MFELDGDLETLLDAVDELLERVDEWFPSDLPDWKRSKVFELQREITAFKRKLVQEQTARAS